MNTMTEREIIQSQSVGPEPAEGEPLRRTRIVLRSRVVWSTASVLQIADVIDAEDEFKWISLPIVENGREVDAQIQVGSIDLYHEASQ